MAKLTNKKILILVEAVYEDLELWYPKIRLIEEGAQVIVAGPAKKTYQGKNGYPRTPDTTIKDDLENAGATYLDRSVVIDGNLISSRTPADLPDFCRAIIRSLD